MNVKKAIKRIAALGTGAAMMGATVLGAMAADLADYPAPFVEDGQFNAMLVVGESADTPDVIGAVDIATSLQYDMRTPAAVSGDASEGETVSVSGDNVRIDLPYNRLTLGENLGDVLDTLTDEDLDALRDGDIDGEGFTQTVELSAAAGNVMYYEEGTDFHVGEPGWYMVYESGDEIYSYEIEFPSGLDYSTDLEDEEFEMFGLRYTIDSVSLDASEEEWEKMELLGGAIRDTLLEDESNTYTLDGNEYEVEVVYGYDGRARFVVNGEQTDTMDEGDTYELSTGTEIGVRRVLPQSGDRPSYVEFFLGADRLVLENGEDLQRGDNSYFNAQVSFDSTTDSVLNSITVTVSADDRDYHVAYGESVASLFADTDDVMFGDFDLHYLGNTEPMMSGGDIRETAEDEQYEFSVTSRAGTYSLPLAYGDGAESWLGDSDGVFHITPDAFGGTVGDGNAWNNDWDAADNPSGIEVWIEEDDYFVLNTDTSSPEDTTSRMFSVNRINWRSNDQWYEVDLRDEDGSSRDVTLRYNDDLSGDAGTEEWEAVFTGSFRVGGQTHRLVAVHSVDADGNLAPSGATAEALGLEVVYHPGVFALETGTYLTFDGIAADMLSQASTDNDGYDLTHVVPEDLLDGSADEEMSFAVSWTDDEPSVGSLSIDGTGWASDGSVDVDDDSYWYTEYGTEVIERDTSRDRWDIQIPHRQVLPQVYATSGSVSVSERHEEATGDAYDVAPISAGIAMLDTEVSNWENENVIVVGGPCVNTVAAEMLGNPAECTEGFEQGVGRIVLQENNGNVAMLVAGYDSDETRHAATVVNEYRDHDFSGTELEVSGSSMSNLQVTSVE